MKDYFYTDSARSNKIYVFRNVDWINQLMLIGEKYQWISLNECGTNWNSWSSYDSMKTAIENAMGQHCVVYQLDTLKELTEFILED